MTTGWAAATGSTPQWSAIGVRTAVATARRRPARWGLAVVLIAGS